MSDSFKQRIKEWICRCFGHNYFEEVYAERCDNLWGFDMPLIHKNPDIGSPKHYIVFTRTTCKRCGECIARQETRPMRRSELLKQGWFITNGENSKITK